MIACGNVDKHGSRDKPQHGIFDPVWQAGLYINSAQRGNNPDVLANVFHSKSFLYICFLIDFFIVI